MDPFSRQRYKDAWGLLKGYFAFGMYRAFCAKDFVAYTSGRLLTPGLERLENHRAFIRPPTVVTLPCIQGPVEAPLDNGVIRVELLVLSLSRERKVGLPLEVWQESWPNFR